VAWIEAHQSLGEHPKLKKAARLLGVSRVQLVGHLFYLWWWALDYAPDGDVSRYGAQELADAAKWEGEADGFTAALEGCRIGDREGFLERTADGRVLIHDWWEYGGKLVQRRQVDAARKRRQRTAGAAPAPPPSDVRPPPSINSADVRRTSDGRPSDVRTQTTNKQTQQTQQTEGFAAPTVERHALNPVRAAPKPDKAEELRALLMREDVPHDLTREDREALKASRLTAGQVAEVYLALSRGEHGDAWQLEHLSVREAIKAWPGYQARRRAPPPATNGAPRKGQRLTGQDYLAWRREQVRREQQGQQQQEHEAGGQAEGLRRLPGGAVDADYRALPPDGAG
jgi:hypothetical protein